GCAVVVFSVSAGADAVASSLALSVVSLLSAAGVSAVSSPLRRRERRRVRSGFSADSVAVFSVVLSAFSAAGSVAGASVVAADSFFFAAVVLAVSAVFAVVVPGLRAGPRCLASFAAMISLLRIRPVPVIPRSDARRCSSVSFSAASPVPPERLRDRVDALLPAGGAASPTSTLGEVVSCVPTAASWWSSVVSLTKGPSQGAGWCRHDEVIGQPGGANRLGPGQACPVWLPEPLLDNEFYPIAAGAGHIQALGRWAA